ncbi:MAG: phage terminase large subunit family protein [Alistipes sp.]|nr:phage terminase large subunit family protein [Alistipes sp.]
METDNYIQKFGEGLMPLPPLTVWEWADANRTLYSEGAAEPGPYRTDRTPYLRRIMECLSVHVSYKEIIFMKGSQIGATEISLNFIGYIIDHCPAPIMFMQPTDDSLETISKVRLKGLIEETPVLKGKVAKAKSRDSNNTLTHKTFKGGALYLRSARSPSGLASVPIRFLIPDEVDRFPGDVGKEGSPLELAKTRTSTYSSNKKIFINSTPTISGHSVIEDQFETTDQHYYHVPCPHCGTFQPLVFSQLKWEKGQPETARYQCAHCEQLIHERYKTQMLANGEWVAHKPENSNPDRIGFHLNTLYSPFGWKSWEELADEWEKAQSSNEKLQTFINTRLGETWKVKGEAPAYKNLYNRREDYPTNMVPDDVCFITAGVDVQKDRLEVEIVGWCSDRRSYSIDYRVLEGDTAKGEVWEELACIVDERWPKSNGVELPMLKMAVDTGYNTSHVYKFCRRFSIRRVIPVKGQDSLRMTFAPPKSIDKTGRGKDAGRTRLYNIGVSFLKEEIYANLRLEKDSEGVAPPGYCHFPQYDEHYFQGLTAEVMVKKSVRGYTRYYWEKIFNRNEPLDCRAYARAAASVVGLDRMKPEQLEEMGGNAVKKSAGGNAPKKPKRPRSSSYWD